MEKSKTVVVVGGGAVGVEIAGDVKEDFKDKRVILVHPHDNFLVNEKVNESFLKTLRARLDSLGVEMVLGKLQLVVYFCCACILFRFIILYIINMPSCLFTVQNPRVRLAKIDHVTLH